MTIRVPRAVLWVAIILLAAVAGALVDHALTDDEASTSVRASSSPTSGAPATPAAHRTRVPIKLDGACGKASARPSEVVFTCADGGVIAKNINWSSWGGKLAVGHGVVLAHDCTPSCAESNQYNSFDVVLIAEQAKSCGTGDRRYTRLEYAWTAGSPYPADAPGSQQPYLDRKCSG